MAARLDPARRTLAFPGVFPGVAAGTALARALTAAVAARSTAMVPAHKRVDRRRLALAGGSRGGQWSLVVTVRTRAHAAAVATALSVLHDLWLLLAEHHPDYLSARFGVSAE
jgi:hypothetical protein